MCRNIPIASRRREVSRSRGSRPNNPDTDSERPGRAVSISTDVGTADQNLRYRPVSSRTVFPAVLAQRRCYERSYRKTTLTGFVRSSRSGRPRETHRGRDLSAAQWSVCVLTDRDAFSRGRRSRRREVRTLKRAQLVNAID